MASGLSDGGDLTRRGVGRAAAAAATGAVIGGVVAPQSAHAAVSSSLQNVVEVVNLIDSMVDMKKWDACRELFHDTVNVDFSSLGGGEPARISRDDLIASWRSNLFAEKASFHMRSNHDVDVTGTRAVVRSRGYALNVMPRALGDGVWEVWADYEHTLRRTGSSWVCDGMTVQLVHARGNEAVRTAQPGN